MRSPPIHALALALLTAPVAPALAQEGDTGGRRPAAAGRIVRAFDFEEREYNPMPVPMGWIRAQDDPAVPRERAGFPIYNGAELDYENPAFSGIGSVKLPTSGGSTSLVLRHGQLNIFPDADYLVTARVRTQDLRHAKARIVAVLLDAQGDEIPGSHTATRLASTNAEWQKIALQVEGVYPNAAFMQLELQLLQPRQQHDQGAAPPFTIWEQDFQGAAWFDNLVVAQLPRLRISTDKHSNIFESADAPALSVLVRDLTGDEITARVRIFDVHGQPVQDHTLTESDRRVDRRWTPALPGFGWYRAHLEAVADDQRVGVRSLDFIWAPPATGARDAGMFSIAAPLGDDRLAAAAPALIRGSGVRRADLTPWDRDTTADDLALGSPTVSAIDALLADGVALSFTLAGVPDELSSANASDPGEALARFAAKRNDWTRWGAPMLDRYGQRVSQWRFGATPSPEPASVLTPDIETVRHALAAFVPGPVVTIPWPVERPPEPELVQPNRKILLIDDDATHEDAMDLLVEQFAALAASASPAASDHPPMLGLTLAPSPPPDDRAGVHAWSAAARLARKAIGFWWAASDSPVDDDRFELQLAHAWWISPGKRGQVMPAPELLVWRTLATHLGPRDAIEELDLVPGVRMLVASRRQANGAPDPDDADAAGALVLWLERPTLEPVTLELLLADTPVTRIDIFGNADTIPLTTAGNIDAPVHRIPITRSPVIIEGIDPELLRFLGNLRLTPDTLQSRPGVHEHALSIANPWSTAITGRLYIVEPGGYTGEPEDIDRSWEITPRVIPFALDPGAAREFPVSFAYSLGEVAGEKTFSLDIELDADGRYPILRVSRPLELGLDGVEVTLIARRTDAGVTIVEATVTNRLDEPQSFEVIAAAPGEPRVRRTINALPAAQSTARQFAFSKATRGDQIVVALMLRGSSARLNKAITVP